MLTALRASLNTWIVKALFVLLIASFAVWGIGDVFTGRSSLDQAAARVGDARITLAEAQEAYRRDLAQLTRTLGPTFEANETIRRSIAESAVTRLIATEAVEAEARRLGLAVPEAGLRDTIRAVPAFQGPDGRFSRPLFDNFLRQNGLTEARLLAGFADDLLRAQLLGAAVAGAVPPGALVEQVHAFREETRIGVAALLGALDVAPPAPPPEAELRRFHELNPQGFTTPERRVLQLATLTLEDVARDVAIADADVAALYEQRRADFTQGPAREVVQVLLQDEANATRVAEALRAGQGLDAATAGVPSDRVELGFATREDLPFEELARAVFEAPVPGIAGPVRSPFGWHVFEVKAAREGSVRPLAEVADALRAELARDRAADRLYERLNRIEDDLAAGRKLPEIASTHGMTLRQVGPVDRTGQGEDGAAAELGPEPERVLEPAFQQAADGSASRPIETQDGTVTLVAVERIVPPALLAYESVAAEVLAAWQAAERRRTQEERAARILSQSGGTLEGFEAAVRAEGLVPRTSEPVTRQGRIAFDPTGQLVQRLFAMKPGETTMLEAPGGFVVAALDTVQPGDPAASAEALTRTRQQLQAAIAGELESQYVQALQAREGVSMNQTLIQDLARP